MQNKRCSYCGWRNHTADDCKKKKAEDTARELAAVAAAVQPEFLLANIANKTLAGVAKRLAVHDRKLLNEKPYIT